MHTYIFLKTLNLGMFNLTLHPLLHRKRGAVQSQPTSTVHGIHMKHLKLEEKSVVNFPGVRTHSSSGSYEQEF